MPVMFATGGAQPAHAQDDVPEYTLKQHRFLTPTIVPTPFVSTDIRLQQGVLYFKVPDFPVTQNRSYNVNAAGITERLTVGVRFLDRIRAYVIAQGDLQTGANAKSIVLAGGTYNYSLSGGLAVRIFRSVKTGTQVSARAQLTSGPLGQLDVLGFANDVIARRPAAIQDVFDIQIARSALASGTEKVLRLDALAAQTLTANFGVQAFLGFTGYWESVKVFDPRQEVDVRTHANSYAPEGGLSVDATLLPTVPLGFNIEYAFQSQRRNLSESQGARTTQLLHTLALGIHVVDSRFQAGLSFGHGFGFDPITRTGLLNKQLTSGTPWHIFGDLQVQYLW